MPKAYVQIMRSRALWRTARTEEAEASLAEAARSAGTGEEAAVASACADFAQYLHLDAKESEQLRQRVGAPGEEASAMRRAIQAEEAGEIGAAFALWLTNLRELQAAGSATAVAFGLEELGRLCAFHGEHEDAVSWLRRRLQVGARLGLDPEQPLRYLGGSAERAERFAEAGSWLGDALSAARAKGDEKAEAECLYELGLVAMQVDEEGTGAGREELERAREIFERIGPPLHVGDC
jgi:tetratricopeptide (TPR) repeat protein